MHKKITHEIIQSTPLIIQTKIKLVSSTVVKKKKAKTLNKDATALRLAMRTCRNDLLRVIDFAIGKKSLPKQHPAYQKPLTAYTAVQESCFLWTANQLAHRLLKLKRAYNALMRARS